MKKDAQSRIAAGMILLCGSVLTFVALIACTGYDTIQKSAAAVAELPKYVPSGSFVLPDGMVTKCKVVDWRAYSVRLEDCDVEEAYECSQGVCEVLVTRTP